MKTILIAGATGQTGLSLLKQSLALGHQVRIIVRSPQKLPKEIAENPRLTIIEGSILQLSDQELIDAVIDVDTVLSCLGHVLSFQGVFGNPRRLCTDATKRLCTAIEATEPTKPAQFILMNTVGVANPDLSEKRTWFEHKVLQLLRWFVPPHRDNEMAAEFLHKNIGRYHKYIEWCSVRPDSLINDEISEYQIVASPTTGLFSGQPTARANVAHFMTKLICDQGLWEKWRFRMPVIMNQ